jgi:hypothetical protein
LPDLETKKLVAALFQAFSGNLRHFQSHVRVIGKGAVKTEPTDQDKTKTTTEGMHAWS